MRFWEIDFSRGIAIILMVIFHFLWDLNYFEFTNLELYSGVIGIFQKIIPLLFLLVVGISLTLNYNRNKQKYEIKFIKQGGLIFGAGLLITIFTLLAFPKQPILFGILHLIGASIILSIFFIKKKYFALITGALIISSTFIFKISTITFPELFWLGFKPIPTLDIYPIFPWFGVVLIGIFLGHQFYENGKAKIIFQKPKLKIINFIELLGKNALLIYFLHQPILFAIFFLITNLT